MFNVIFLVCFCWYCWYNALITHKAPLSKLYTHFQFNWNKYAPYVVAVRSYPLENLNSTQRWHFFTLLDININCFNNSLRLLYNGLAYKQQNHRKNKKNSILTFLYRNNYIVYESNSDKKKQNECLTCMSTHRTLIIPMRLQARALP